MAFIDEDHDDPQKFSSFYNVNGGVGYGGVNMVEDVKVVQFFLKRIFSVGVAQDRPWGEMVVDGKVGPITRAWIVKFQSNLRKLGGNVLVDGVIDKAGAENNPSNWDTSVSKTNYTIRLLNTNLLKLDTEVYKTLESHPVVPPDVRIIFGQIKAAGPAMHYNI